jgi:hypothetical protein
MLQRYRTVIQTLAMTPPQSKLFDESLELGDRPTLAAKISSDLQRSAQFRRFIIFVNFPSLED